MEITTTAPAFQPADMTRRHREWLNSNHCRTGLTRGKRDSHRGLRGTPRRVGA
ncbi:MULTISPECIES: hypothetical protein [Geobacter]|uniref:hypothetical protein n=1 Tax=Geobacter TaxID=28231 RepID=UPI0025729A82|nr:hypothetical protein [Geobacter sulfurreducens]BEH08614.1 hypothetical protein GSUET_02260 [Geobacter sulfurreducens subsp. ethanolicus]HML77525.1 hypothetical protein [Geobacter sulfurreducens]